MPEALAAYVHAAAHPARRSGQFDARKMSPVQPRPCGPADQLETPRRISPNLSHRRGRRRRYAPGGCLAAASPAKFQRPAPVRCCRGRLSGRGHGLPPAAARQPHGACARPPVRPSRCTLPWLSPAAHATGQLLRLGRPACPSIDALIRNYLLRKTMQ